MGYSSNPAVLEARRELLVELELGRACRWTCKPDRDVTRRKAYEIREALYIASIHPEDYPALALAHKAFAIKIIKPGLIEAVRKPGVEAADLKPKNDIPVHGIEPFGRPVQTVAVSSAREVIKAWEDHAPSLDAINFPQSTLSVVELTVLWHWANEHTPRLMILGGEADGFLTLSLRDPEMGDYAWAPPKPTTTEESFDGRL